MSARDDLAATDVTEAMIEAFHAHIAPLMLNGWSTEQRELVKPIIRDGLAAALATAPAAVVVEPGGEAVERCWSNRLVVSDGSIRCELPASLDHLHASGTWRWETDAEPYRVSAPEPVEPSAAEVEARATLARLISQCQTPNWWDDDEPATFDDDQSYGVPSDEDWTSADAVLHWLAARKVTPEAVGGDELVHAYGAAGFLACGLQTGGAISRHDGYDGPALKSTLDDAKVTCPNCAARTVSAQEVGGDE